MRDVTGFEVNAAQLAKITTLEAAVNQGSVLTAPAGNDIIVS
jgi:hypothetical protein